MADAQFQYGVVGLGIVKTNSYERIAVYDQSGVDLLHVLHRIDVNCVINPHVTSYQAGSEPIAAVGEMAPDTDAAIRAYLETPRRPLLYLADNQTLLESPPFSADRRKQAVCDAIGGPFPRVYGIRRISGAKTFLCRFMVETGLIECPSGSDEGALVSNRYAQAHSILEDHRTIITTSGQSVFRLDFLENSSGVADLYRSRCLPPVPAGFQRRRVTIVATPNRSTLTWQTVDEEKFFDLGDTDPRRGGSGALDVDATYTISSIPTEAGPVNTAYNLEQCDVRVRGSKISSTWALTQKAIQVVQTRLPIFADGVFLRHISVTQSITGRDVRMSVAVQTPVKDADTFGVIDAERMRLDKTFLDQGGINPGLENDSGTRGTYSNLALTSALQLACYPPDPPTEGLSNPGDPNPNNSNSTLPVVQVSASDVVPLLGAAVSRDGASAVYTDYHINIGYKKTQGILMGPVAGPAGTAAEFMTVAAPTSTREVHWMAERVGRPPTIPHPNPTDPNYVLLDTYISPVASLLSADGQQTIRRVEGVYTYGCKLPKGAGDEVSGGAMPWMVATYDQNRILITSYSDGLIDNVGLRAAAGPNA